jgi:signal transduction histidine kinase
LIREDQIRKDDKDYEKILDELKFNEERLTALLKMTQLKGLSEKEYIDYTLEECVRLTNSKVGYLHFINEDQNSLSLYTWSKGVLEHCTATKTPHYPIEKAGIWADCFREKKPVIHNDYDNYPQKKGYPEGHFPVKRHMSIPVFDRDKVVSIVGVGNKEDPYNDSDTRQLYLFMDRMWRIIKQNRNDELLKKSELKYKEAYNRVEFYKQIFAHDMRNILQIISLLSSTLLLQMKEIEDNDDIGQLLRKLHEQVFKGKNLISKVQRLSEIESDEDLKKIDVISTLQSINEAIKNDFIEKKVVISFENKLTEFYILANDMLSDIFENILINAITHNENDTIRIIIKVSQIKEKSKELIKIEFIDNGMGIPNDMKHKILNGEYVKRDGSPGMGLGLTLIQTLLKSFDASLFIEDNFKGKPSKGTNFIVVFPKFL